MTVRPDTNPPETLKALQKKIHIRFEDQQLLVEAMTHISHAMEHGEGFFNNERLEFLGDSVLNAAVTEFLFRRFPKDNEGRLSKLKSQLVSRASLVEWAKELKLGQYILMSGSEEQSGGRHRDSIMSNAVEALIGAIFLDQGFDKAREFVLEKFSRKKRIVETDYKSKLQEMIQKKFRMPPTYVILDETGPDHDKIFHVQVRVRKDALGEGKGRSKKEAEQDAAYRAIKVHKNSITSLA